MVCLWDGFRPMRYLAANLPTTSSVNLVWVTFSAIRVAR